MGLFRGSTMCLDGRAVPIPMGCHVEGVVVGMPCGGEVLFVSTGRICPDALYVVSAPSPLGKSVLNFLARAESHPRRLAKHFRGGVVEATRAGRVGMGSNEGCCTVFTFVPKFGEVDVCTSKG